MQIRQLDRVLLFTLITLLMMRSLSEFVVLFSLIFHLSLAQINEKYLLSWSFQGTWRILHSDSKEKYSAFPQIQGNAGIADIYFTQIVKDSNQVSGLQLWLLMPKYYDQKVLRIIIQFQKGNINQYYQRWQGESNSLYEIYDNTQKIDSGTVKFKFIIDDSLIALSFDQVYSVIITFKMKYVSPNTSFYFALLALIVFLFIRRKYSVQNTHITHQSIPIILPIILTFLVSMAQIIIGFRSLFGVMNPQAFFTVSGCINLAICYKIVLFYWRLVLKKKIWIFAIWILSTVYIWFLLFMRHNYICLVLNSLIFIPEIGFHCIRGKKIQRDLRFIVFVVYSQLYVLYFKACPSNIFKESPSHLLAYSIPSFLLVQIGILLGQVRWGSRFFIPAFILPIQHDYFDKKIVHEATKKGNQCHICLQQIKMSGKIKSKIMVTPCQHIFHAQCLQKWMVVQMKCPVDRSDLPAF